MTLLRPKQGDLVVHHFEDDWTLLEAWVIQDGRIKIAGFGDVAVDIITRTQFLIPREMMKSSILESLGRRFNSKAEMDLVVLPNSVVNSIEEAGALCGKIAMERELNGIA